MTNLTCKADSSISYLIWSWMSNLIAQIFWQTNDSLYLAVTRWLHYSLSNVSSGNLYKAKMSIQNIQDLQQQRHPAMSMIRANPFMSQKIPIEHQQRLHQNQNLQQQYYYGQQSQPQMGVLYNPQAWYPHQEQQYQGMPPGNYQYWYGMPQHVNSPQVFQHNAALPGTFSQQKNGAYGQVNL